MAKGPTEGQSRGVKLRDENGDGYGVKHTNNAPHVVVESLPGISITGVSTEAKQDDIISAIENINSSTEEQSVIDESVIIQLKESQETAETELGLNAAQLLLTAMDKAQKMPIQVELPVNLKQEPDGALYIADMKGPIFWNTKDAVSPITIDCQGYQSVLVHKITTGVVTPTVSNDGVNFVASLAAPVSTMVAATTLLTATNIYVMPVVSRYLRLTGTAATSITCYIYLSQAPFQSIIAVANQSSNMAQVAGTATVTAGVSGMIATGGNIAAGVAPTANPVPMGGADGAATPLTRRVLTDEKGRQIIGNMIGQRTTGVNMIGLDPAYRNPLEVQDTTRGEDGLSTQDVLVQILKELKIQNILIYEMAKGTPLMDDPEMLRNEYRLFN